MRAAVTPVVIGALGTFPIGLERGLENLKNQRMNRSHPDYSIVEIDQNTEKSPGGLRRLAVTQTPVKGHQLTLVWKKNSFAQPNTCPRKWHVQTPEGPWYTNVSPNLGLKTRPYNTLRKEKKICKIVDFAVPADHRIKLKECENRDKYLDLARELKKLWNMKVTIIPIVIGAFGTVSKGLFKGLEDLEFGSLVETIQTKALLKTARILRRFLETCGDLLSLNLQLKTSSLRWCEKL